MRPRFFSFRTSVLNGSRSRPDLVGQVAGPDGGHPFDQPQRVARPRSMAARPVEPVEPSVDLGAVVGGEHRVGRELGAGIGLVDHVEADPVEVEVGRAPEVGDQRAAVVVAAGSRVGVGDVVDGDDVDGVGLDDRPPGCGSGCRRWPAGASTGGT